MKCAPGEDIIPEHMAQDYFDRLCTGPHGVENQPRSAHPFGIDSELLASPLRMIHTRQLVKLPKRWRCHNELWLRP